MLGSNVSPDFPAAGDFHWLALMRRCLRHLRKLCFRFDVEEGCRLATTCSHQLSDTKFQRMRLPYRDYKLTRANIANAERTPARIRKRNRRGNFLASNWHAADR